MLLKKCCVCFPLRKGLLCIGYLRLVICLLTILQFTLMCVDVFTRMQDSYEDAVTFLKSVASIVPQLLDLIFTLTFLVAAHKKCVKLFEVYFFYCATMVLLYTLAVLLICCDLTRFHILYQIVFQYAWYIHSGYYEYIGSGLLVIMLQIYLTLLVRSEVHHLKERRKAELARQRSSTSFRLPQLRRTN